MRPSEMLRDASAETWAAVADHPFCHALADGTLPGETLAWYLVQDYSFIENFVRLAGSAIAHAPSLADAIPLAQFLAVITGPENTYFQRSFDVLGVPEEDRTAPDLAEPARAFQALMAEAAESGEYGRMIAVLTVAEWTYLDWATPHAAKAAVLPFQYGEWIGLHVGPGFEGVVAYLRGQLDAEWDRLGDAAREQVAADFARAVALEKDFFDAAWRAGRD